MDPPSIHFLRRAIPCARESTELVHQALGGCSLSSSHRIPTHPVLRSNFSNLHWIQLHSWRPESISNLHWIQVHSWRPESISTAAITSRGLACAPASAVEEDVRANPKRVAPPNAEVSSSETRPSLMIKSWREEGACQCRQSSSKSGDLNPFRTAFRRNTAPMEAYHRRF